MEIPQWFGSYQLTLEALKETGIKSVHLDPLFDKPGPIVPEVIQHKVKDFHSVERADPRSKSILLRINATELLELVFSSVKQTSDALQFIEQRMAPKKQRPYLPSMRITEKKQRVSPSLLQRMLVMRQKRASKRVNVIHGALISILLLAHYAQGAGEWMEPLPFWDYVTFIATFLSFVSMHLANKSLRETPLNTLMLRNAEIDLVEQLQKEYAQEQKQLTELQDATRV